MKIQTALFVLFSLALQGSFAQLSPADKIPVKKKEDLTIQPVMHASLVLNYNKKTVYVDPAGGAELFEGLPDPDMILITDIGKDHFDIRTLESIHTANAIFIVPQIVADMFPDMLIRKKLVVFNNGDMHLFDGVGVAAIPMYNLPESENAAHVRGQGNGYVVGLGGNNIYVSGETDAIPEMRGLKNINIAFLCMNQPHTMKASEAAETVLQFKPTIVYPYDYEGGDISAFKTIVNDADKTIDVRIRNWYPSGNTMAVKQP